MKKALIKKEYNDAFNSELNRVNIDMENFEKHISLIAFSKDTVVKTASELETYENKKITGSEIANKVENFKRQEEELKEQTTKLVSIRIAYPSVDFNATEFDKTLRHVANIQHRSTVMTQKKVCFFGDQNKVMQLDLQTEKWRVKQLPRTNNEFLYYSAAVTLPNGDALITGGGSSTTVY